MSHIPNAAIPHAVANDAETDTIEAPSTREKAAKLAERAKTTVMEHPKTAIAAGAAVVAGAVAAAAIPLVRSRSKSPAAKSSASKAKKA